MRDMQLFDWQNLIHDNFLQNFCLSTSENQPTFGYHWRFQFGHINLFILQWEQVFKINEPDMDYEFVASKYAQAIKQLYKQHEILQYQYQPKTKIQPESAKHQKTPKPIINYYLGLLALEVEYEDKIYLLDYPLNNEILLNNDLKKFINLKPSLQLINAQNFIELLNILKTPSDLIQFLQFYQHTLIEQHPYENEIALANTYIQQGKFLPNVEKVEQRLIELGMAKDKGRETIRNFIEQTDNHLQHLQELANDMYVRHEMWERLLTKLQNQQQFAPSVKDLKILKQMSLYTRMKVVEDIMSYAYLPASKRHSGFVYHQHDFSEFGQHFVLLFYGKDDYSKFGKIYIRQFYPKILEDLLAHPTLLEVDDILLLGVDMSHTREDGSIDVRLDVFSQDN